MNKLPNNETANFEKVLRWLLIIMLFHLTCIPQGLLFSGAYLAFAIFGPYLGFLITEVAFLTIVGWIGWDIWKHSKLLLQRAKEVPFLQFSLSGMFVLMLLGAAYFLIVRMILKDDQEQGTLVAIMITPCFFSISTAIYCVYCQLKYDQAKGLRENDAAILGRPGFYSALAASIFILAMIYLLAPIVAFVEIVFQTNFTISGPFPLDAMVTGAGLLWIQSAILLVTCVFTGTFCGMVSYFFHQFFITMPKDEADGKDQSCRG